MNIKSFSIIFSLLFTVGMVSACTQSAPATPQATPQPTQPTMVDATATAEAQPGTAKYAPIPLSVCQNLQEAANQALGVKFDLNAQAPFEDIPGGESGQGCLLSVQGDGNQFADPQGVLQKLIDSVGVGWDEQTDYQAGGPTGAATGLTRDMGLMLISVNWSPVAEANCPTDQPIASCTLTPEQKNYTVTINTAEYQTDFSLDGHWVDAATGFTLDLQQEWKNIWGGHSIVAAGGKKIDALDDSIQGKLKGKTVDVVFKSSFTSETGTAQITYVDVDTITWKIITPPGGEYYLPAEATLTRK
jgi:hypothetical protein